MRLRPFRKKYTVMVNHFSIRIVAHWFYNIGFFDTGVSVQVFKFNYLRYTLFSYSTKMLLKFIINLEAIDLVMSISNVCSQIITIRDVISLGSSPLMTLLYSPCLTIIHLNTLKLTNNVKLEKYSHCSIWTISREN